MSELTYDPDLPYAVEWQPGSVWARFHQESDALEYVEREGGTFVDTTPKPKIPEDAEFIYYLDSGGEGQFGHRDTYEGKEIWWTGVGDYLTTSDILGYIGDAEITVLVRKEDV